MKRETEAKLRAVLAERYRIMPETLVQVGSSTKLMPLHRAFRYCRPGSAIRLAGNSRNLVERGLDGTWYY